MTATIFDIEEQLCAIRLLELPLHHMRLTLDSIESLRVLECAKCMAEDAAALASRSGSVTVTADRLSRSVALSLELRRRDPAA